MEHLSDRLETTSGPDAVYTELFERAAPRLFSVVAEALGRRRDEYERNHGTIDDETAEYLFERAIVCVDHLRFIPCRQCMYDTPAATPYSDEPEDVERVRAHRSRPAAPRV